MHFKTQFKAKSPTESWRTVGMYGSEVQAIQSALSKKNRGAVLVRVVDKKGGVVYVG